MEIKSIDLNDRPIKYNLYKTNRKTFVIQAVNGQINVRCNKLISQSQIDEILHQNKEKILTLYKEQENIFENGKDIKILNESYVLRLSFLDVKTVKIYFEGRALVAELPIVIKEDEAAVEKLFNRFFVIVVNDYVNEILPELTGKIAEYPKKVTVKKMKTRWGSCSSEGNISINSKLALYSKKAVEYVIIHELCHMKELNHSAKFWTLVESYMPDYKRYEEELSSKS